MDNALILSFDESESSAPESADLGQRERERIQAFSAGTVDESMLSEKEKQIIEDFVSRIDLENVAQTADYGLAAQQKISDFSVSVLSKVRTTDLGDIGQSLRALTVALDSTIEPEKKGILKAFQKAKKGVDSLRANYAKAEVNVDKIEHDLRIHQKVLGQDIEMYQQMFDLNLRYCKEITMYIIAGKKALEQTRQGKLQEMKSQANKSGLQEDAQSYRDLDDLCTRFEKKLNDLELTRVISIQTAPQIRLLQNNAREMKDKIQSSLANTIPLWRNQLVLALGIEHSRRAAEAQMELSDRTNRLLAMNAETLHMATVEAAKATEKPIVEIETLQKCNTELINSVSDVIRIHEENREKREQARQELVRIEEELKRTLLGEIGSPNNNMTDFGYKL